MDLKRPGKALAPASWLLEAKHPSTLFLPLNSKGNASHRLRASAGIRGEAHTRLRAVPGHRKVISATTKHIRSAMGQTESLNNHVLES